MNVGIRKQRGLEAIMVSVEDAELVNYLDFKDINALTSSCQVLYSNRKTTRIRWIRFNIKPEQCEICNLDYSKIAKVHTNVLKMKLSSPGLDFTAYGWSIPVTSKPNFKRHLENDNYDVVKLLWPYVYSPNDLEAGIIKYSLVEFVAQTPRTVNKIDFLLKLGIKTCRTCHREPFLHSMLSAVFKVKRDSETVTTVERLIAWGADPMIASMPTVEKRHNGSKGKSQEQVKGMLEIVDVLILSGINLMTNLYDSALGRTLCRQYESRYTDAIDYLIEKDQVDALEVIKGALWKSNPLKRENEELVERAIEVSVKHGHDHILNLFTKRSDLNRLTGRHVVLAAKYCQGSPYQWLLNNRVVPTSDETHEIISDMLSRKPDSCRYGYMQDTHIWQVLLNHKLITPIEIFDILVESSSANRVYNWDSVNRILMWMSRNELIDDLLTDRGEGAFIILTNSIDNLVYYIACLCVALNFANGRKLPAIDEKNGESENRVAVLEKILQMAAGPRGISKLLVKWILDTPGFQPSRETIRNLLFSKPVAIDLFEQLLNFDYVSQLELYDELSDSFYYRLEPRDLAAMLSILSKRGLQPPPSSFVNKFSRAPLLTFLANSDCSDLLLWFLNMDQKPKLSTFEIGSLTEICIRRNLFDFLEKLVDLNLVTVDLIVEIL
ncbi:hypothetical protein HDU76_002203 [Blyttiomyces sp. JEL0837]|nr:hypothetical protein HDU76_002203 [Blyttiomyces sp. JEL0837]